MTRRFRFVDHTSEVGIEATGGSLEEAFAAAGEGVADLLGAWFPGEGEPRAVQVEAPDRQALLATWVDELLYLHESGDLVFGGIHVRRVWEGSLDAVVSVASRGNRRLEGVGVKAATYHGLAVAGDDDTWTVRVFVDV